MWGERTRALAPALPPGDASETLLARPTVQASSLHLDSKVLSDLPSSFVHRTPGTWDPQDAPGSPGAARPHAPGSGWWQLRFLRLTRALGESVRTPVTEAPRCTSSSKAGRAWTSRREASEDRSPEEHAPAPSSAARCSALPARLCPRAQEPQSIPRRGSQNASDSRPHEPSNRECPWSTPAPRRHTGPASTVPPRG